MTPKTLIRTLVNNLRVDNLLKLLGYQTLPDRQEVRSMVDNLLRILAH